MDENCHVEPIEKTATDAERKNIETIMLSVSGMGCPNCANRVRNSLLTLNGVIDARVDHEAGLAQVAFNPNFAPIDILIRAISSAGGDDGRHEYRARPLEQS